MQQRRAVIIRCRWDSVPAGWPDPPPIPDQTLVDMFSETAGLWSVAQLWHDATLGNIRFTQAVILDAGKLSGLSITKLADGTTTNPDRKAVVAAARQRVEAGGFAFGPGDVPVAFICPPPSDAGGVQGYACQLDVGGNHSFMAHEFGHALSFDHSWGPAFGNPDSEYCDPYCVMSHDIDGYRAPWADGLAPGTPVPQGLPADWTLQMGPLPAAATVWRYCDDFARSQSVAEFDLTHPPSNLSILSYGAAFSPSNLVLGIAKTGAHTWLIEHRGAHGWDRGIGQGPKWNPGANGNYDPTPPGVVIHRLDAAGNIAFVDVIDERKGAPQRWLASDDAFTVTLNALSPDGRVAEIEVGPPRLRGQRVGTETSDLGAAVTALNGTFIAESPYIGWAGSGNRRLNVARSDAQDHHVAHDDTAIDHLDMSSDGNTLWTAWTGTNPGHNLNVYSGTAGQPFTAKVVRLLDSSPNGPGAACFQNRLALGYRGNDSRLYFVADGMDPASPARPIGTETTSAGPRLAAMSGRLYVAWVGTDGEGQLNIMSSSDGLNWENKWTFPEETSRYAPAVLGTQSERLYVAWTGRDGGQSLNLGMIELAALTQPDLAGRFSGKLTYPTGSIGGPSLAGTTSGADLVLAWAGLDGPGNLYVAYIDSPFAPLPPDIH